MGSPRRVLVLLLTVFAVGLALGTFKGDSSGLRGAVGNLSAPWLLIGLLSAVSRRTVARGAAIGLVSTLVALVGFYTALTLVLAGHLGGGGHLRELAVEMTANRVYFAAGLVSGPLLGAVGAWLGRRHPDAVPLVAGALVAGEILVVALAQGHQLAPPPLYLVWGVDAWSPYVVECVVGLAMIAVTLARRRLSRTAETHVARSDGGGVI